MLPEPPADPPSGWQPTLCDSVEAWRLHRDEPDEIVTRPPSAPPRYRFDDPLAEYAVSYANIEEVGAFLEVYGYTQRIGSAERGRRRWHDWYAEADGIRYRSRQENDTLNLCFFLDRCDDALTVGPSVRLDQIDRRELLRLIAPYRIVIDW